VPPDRVPAALECVDHRGGPTDLTGS
jgi:hypothetical protein